MRILLVTSRFPLPPWRGNQVRTVQWIEALAEHQVTVVCPRPAPPSERRDNKLSAAVATYRCSPAARLRGLAAALLRGVPLQEGLYAVTPGRRATLRAVSEGSWDLAIMQMVRTAWAADLLRSAAPEVPLLFDAIDSMALHFDRGASDFPVVLRPLVRMEVERCRRREHALANRAAVTTAVSQRDLDALAPPAGAGVVVPVWARRTTRQPQPAEQPTVLLSGNLGYRPTVSAATWFAHEVWPRVLEAVPDARWVVAGARPRRAVRALAHLHGVEIHADPEDLGPYLAAATVAVAPMTAGSGVPMKVLEAWAAGVPVVAHPWTAAGLEPGGETALELAADADAWVEAVTGLLNNPRAAAALAKNGFEQWTRTYSPECVRAAVVAAVTAAAGRS